MASKNKDSVRAGSAAKRPKGGDGRRDGLGDALRTVYDGTVGEDIPSEMLALLSKLD